VRYDSDLDLLAYSLRRVGLDQLWKESHSSVPSNGSVTLQGPYITEPFGSNLHSVFVSLEHDIFTPQPVTNANVFMCRVIIHDYGRTNAMKILQHLRKAANQDTKLLLVEVVSCSPSFLSFSLTHTHTRSLIMLAP
jgi:O-methyltransferase domain